MLRTQRGPARGFAFEEAVAKMGSQARPPWLPIQTRTLDEPG